MMKLLTALLALAAGLAIGVEPALAQSASPAAKQTEKKALAKKAAAKKEAAADEDDKEPDVSASATTDYHCDHGSKLTIYRNAEDDKHIGLRWNKRLLRLTRVQTSTGANRFENGKNGLVWIDIPTKGMLLDAKKGRQLANECKSPEQMAPKTSEASAV